MTPAALASAALEILTAAHGGVPVDRELHHWGRRHRFAGSRDRQHLAALVYGVLRYRVRLTWRLVRAGADWTPRLGLLAYHLIVEGQTPAALANIYNGSQYAPAPLTGGERRKLERLHVDTEAEVSMPLAVKGECPDWAASTLEARYGNCLPTLLDALQKQAPVDLRVNTLHIDRMALLEQVRASGLSAQPTPHSPLGIRIGQRFAFDRLPALKNGHAEIQDEAAQLAALLVGVKSGMAVLDFCAGAGGKSLALAASMENKGRLVSLDIISKRLEEAKRRLRKAGVHNATVRLMEDRWCVSNAGKFDRVLVDAPCTGTGTWRRNPDARFRYTAADVQELVAKQRAILSQAGRLVKPGGELWYATCSLLGEENDAQVAWFNEVEVGFSPLVMKEAFSRAGLGELVGIKENSLQLTPHQHGTDGFFVAAWKRN
ncbi:MAG: RsmB/NOP family class I SAM-dependent RNA methyltransferase [Holosporales bacterium]|jgi:16S rRNA (cytosine967-C5)-methyltransferase